MDALLLTRHQLWSEIGGTKRVGVNTADNIILKEAHTISRKIHYHINDIGIYSLLSMPYLSVHGLII